MTSPEYSYKTIVAASLTILEDYLILLKSIPDYKYTKTSLFIPNSSIGKHFRHVLDHFRLLLTPSESGNIYYDIRDRNRIPALIIHLDMKIAEQVINQLKDLVVKAYKHIKCNSVVMLRVTVEPTTPFLPLTSTFGRELWFVCNHAIHHAALIKAICIELDIKCNDFNTMSPSTLKYKLLRDESKL